jgi:hypothetical protein
MMAASAVPAGGTKRTERWPRRRSSLAGTNRLRHRPSPVPAAPLRSQPSGPAPGPRAQLLQPSLAAASLPRYRPIPVRAAPSYIPAREEPLVLQGEVVEPAVRQRDVPSPAGTRRRPRSSNPIPAEPSCTAQLRTARAAPVVRRRVAPSPADTSPRPRNSSPVLAARSCTGTTGEHSLAVPLRQSRRQTHTSRTWLWRASSSTLTPWIVGLTRTALTASGVASFVRSARRADWIEQ